MKGLFLSFALISNPLCLSAPQSVPPLSVPSGNTPTAFQKSFRSQPVFTTSLHDFSAPRDLCLFKLLMSMRFLWQEYCGGLPFPPLVDHDLSELFTMTCLFWVALQGKAHSFIELCKLHRHHKAVIRDKPRQRNKKQRHHFADKGPSSQSYGFSRSHVWM